jgi:hypothetical protein
MHTEYKYLMRKLIEGNFRDKRKSKKIEFYSKALLIKITPTFRKLNNLLGMKELSSEKIQDCFIDQLEAYLSVLTWDYKVTKSDKSLLFWNKITLRKK